MARTSVRLFVEGGDDAHFIKHFLLKRGGRELNVGSHLVSCGSSGQVIERIPTIAKESAPARIGLILDADRDPDKRWELIRDEAAKAWGEQLLPEQPESDGTIVQLPDSRSFGVWMMPGPGMPGDMETFLIEIRDQTEPQVNLWNQARTSVETLLQPTLFEAKDAHKAEIRTWLAWQKEPGAPYGLAVSFGVFNLDHPWAVAFGGWLDRLVGLP